MPVASLRFRCYKCRQFGIPRFGFALAIIGRVKRIRPSSGKRVSRWNFQYRCLACDHVGWSRHTEAERRFRWTFGDPEKYLV